jgi:aldose 1-epimerase
MPDNIVETREDAEITLSLGDLRLIAAPLGASLRGLYRQTPDGGREVIASCYSGKANKTAGEGDVLIPFPGRVAAGHYVFNGREHQMLPTDKDGPNAIHGFLRTMLWSVSQPSESEITFSVDFPGADPLPAGYPFPLRAEVTYRLVDHGMECAFSVTNTGDEAAPVAAGFHPYFTVGTEWIDSALLRVGFSGMQEFDSGLIPTGQLLPVGGSAFDFREARPIGRMAFNNCYVDPIRDTDGRARVALTNPDTGRSVAVWMDAAFDYVVLFSADNQRDSFRRRYLAIEPMTCGADGFNHPEWGLVALQPGETVSGVWGVEVV